MRCGSNLRWTDVGETGMRHGLVPDAQVHAPVPAISRAICLHPPPSWGVGEPKAPFARRGKHGCKPTASPGRGRVKAHQALEACGPCPGTLESPGEINIKPHRNTMVLKRGNSPRPLSHASASPLQWQRSFSVPESSARRPRCTQCRRHQPPGVGVVQPQSHHQSWMDLVCASSRWSRGARGAARFEVQVQGLMLHPNQPLVVGTSLVCSLHREPEACAYQVLVHNFNSGQSTGCMLDFGGHVFSRREGTTAQQLAAVSA